MVAVEVVGPGRHGEGIQSRLDQEGDHDLGLPNLQAAGRQLLRRQAELDEEVGPDLLPGSFDGLDGELEPPLDAASVGVGAFVRIGRQELGDQVAMSTVNLDAVGSGLLGSPGALGEFLDQVLDLRDAELPWHGRFGSDRRVGHAEQRRGWNRGRGYRLQARGDLSAAVRELNHECRTVFVNRLRQIGPTPDDGVVPDSGGEGGHAPFGSDSRRGWDDHRRSTPGPRLVEADRSLGHAAVLVRESRFHPGHDDAISQLDGTNLDGTEESLESAHRRSSSVRCAPVESRGSILGPAGGGRQREAATARGDRLMQFDRGVRTHLSHSLRRGLPPTFFIVARRCR